MFNSGAGSLNGPPPALPPPHCDHDNLHGHDFPVHATTHHAPHADSSYLATSGPPFYPAHQHDLVIREAYSPSSSLGWGPSAALPTNSNPDGAAPYETRPPVSLMPVSPYHQDASALPYHVSNETHDQLVSRPLCPVDHMVSTPVGNTPPSPSYLASPPASMQAHMGNGLMSTSPNSIDHWTHGAAAPHTPSFTLDEEYAKAEGGVQRTNVSCPTTFTSVPSPASHFLVGTTQPVDVPSAHTAQTIPSPSGASNPRPRHLSKSRTESRQPRKYLPPDKWETYKYVIRQLYLDEGKPLKEVMQIMKECHGFEASAKMYKTRFSQWGFAKNNTVDEIKKLLAMKFERDAKGKVTEFIRNGRPVNLRTYLKRKGVTEYDLLDLASPAELPPHVRCRTPTPPPGLTYLRPPDQLHAQELLVGNMNRVFLHLRQQEQETGPGKPRGWASTLTWGAGSSDMIYEAGRLFASGQNGPAGDILSRAFGELELDLRRLSSQGLRELVLAMAHRNLDVVLAISQYVASYTATKYEAMHPLRLAFNCLYEMQQKHGASALTELVWGSVPVLAGEMEKIYGRRSPYVTRFWVDLAMLHGYVDTHKLGGLFADLQALERGVLDEHGTAGTETLGFRFTQAYLLFLTCPEKALDQTMAFSTWRELKRSKMANRVRGRPNMYCFHSTLTLEPWMKRSREKYAMLSKMVQRTIGVELIPYFEGEPHVWEHAEDDEEDDNDAPGYAGAP
ncbi:hypothetical protein ACRALDRAFT_1080999 [Sodiomyces alcalophilus JCM 7366]|uniref:uncharacterized protein n=1 Tax=Sodiomyces alcalophilus JCM 7366 TaxID=591952 RepID=UPI0039B42B3C